MGRKLLALACALTVVGCRGPAGSPISSSLTDLTFETRTHQGKVLSHSEILNVAGLSHVPDVGLLYHYTPKGRWPWSKEVPPNTALGISRDHSFRLVGAVNTGDASEGGGQHVITDACSVCTHSVRRPLSPFSMRWCTLSSLLEVRISSFTPEAPSNVPSSMSVIRLLLRLLRGVGSRSKKGKRVEQG